MAERVDLLIIDPQVDFCDPSGALFVPGADKDMERVASLIDKMGTKINKIHVTLDCHHLFDIAHGIFWRNSDGKNPDPFTIISNKDIVDGIWFPIFQKLPTIDPDTGDFIDARKYAKWYTKRLEEGGRYPLCIWPEHCLISNEGNNVMPILFNALQNWEKNNNDNINFVSKGSNILTENYSVLQCEVPLPNDPTTQLNTRFIEDIEKTDLCYICGEASSHCLKSSVEDLANNFNDDSYIKKLCLFEDGTSPVISPVVDFPAIAQQFINDMKVRGMQVAKTTDF
jgi:nicotinamidase/pyrazinamidase